MRPEANHKRLHRTETVPNGGCLKVLGAYRHIDCGHAQ